MAQQYQNSQSTDWYYLVILVLLAYFLSSAPRYVRDWKESHEKVMTAPDATRTWIKALAVYTVKPYAKAWQQWQPASQIATILK